MPTFPKLKTGAVAQYPARRRLSFSTEVQRFLDGSEQRYRQSGTVQRRWAIDLTALGEDEIRMLEVFFLANQGAFGSFAFVDPWDGEEYSDCSFDQDTFEFRADGELRCATKLVIRQNRS